MSIKAVMAALLAAELVAVEVDVAAVPIPNTPAYLGNSPLIVIYTMNPASRKNAMMEDCDKSGPYGRQSTLTIGRPFDANEIADNQNDDNGNPVFRIHKIPPKNGCGERLPTASPQ